MQKIFPSPYLGPSHSPDLDGFSLGSSRARSSSFSLRERLLIDPQNYKDTIKNSPPSDARSSMLALGLPDTSLKVFCTHYSENKTKSLLETSTLFLLSTLLENKTHLSQEIIGDLLNPAEKVFSKEASPKKVFERLIDLEKDVDKILANDILEIELKETIKATLTVVKTNNLGNLQAIHTLEYKILHNLTKTDLTLYNLKSIKIFNLIFQHFHKNFYTQMPPHAVVENLQSPFLNSYPRTTRLSLTQIKDNKEKLLTYQGIKFTENYIRTWPKEFLDSCKNAILPYQEKWELCGNDLYSVIALITYHELIKLTGNLTGTLFENPEISPSKLLSSLNEAKKKNVGLSDYLELIDGILKNIGIESQGQFIIGIDRLKGTDSYMSLPLQIKQKLTETLAPSLLKRLYENNTPTLEVMNTKLQKSTLDSIKKTCDFREREPFGVTHLLVTSSKILTIGIASTKIISDLESPHSFNWMTSILTLVLTKIISEMFYLFTQASQTLDLKEFSSKKGAGSALVETIKSANSTQKAGLSIYSLIPPILASQTQSIPVLLGLLFSSINPKRTNSLLISLRKLPIAALELSEIEEYQNDMSLRKQRTFASLMVFLNFSHGSTWRSLCSFPPLSWVTNAYPPEGNIFGTKVIENPGSSRFEKFLHDLQNLPVIILFELLKSIGPAPTQPWLLKFKKHILSTFQLDHKRSLSDHTHMRQLAHNFVAFIQKRTQTPFSPLEKSILTLTEPGTKHNITEHLQRILYMLLLPGNSSKNTDTFKAILEGLTYQQQTANVAKDFSSSVTKVGCRNNPFEKRLQKLNTLELKITDPYHWAVKKMNFLFLKNQTMVILACIYPILIACKSVSNVSIIPIVLLTILAPTLTKIAYQNVLHMPNEKELGRLFEKRIFTFFKSPEVESFEKLLQDLSEVTKDQEELSGKTTAIAEVFELAFNGKITLKILQLLLPQKQEEEIRELWENLKQKKNITIQSNSEVIREAKNTEERDIIESEIAEVIFYEHEDEKVKNLLKVIQSLSQKQITRKIDSNFLKNYTLKNSGKTERKEKTTQVLDVLKSRNIIKKIISKKGNEVYCINGDRSTVRKAFLEIKNELTSLDEQEKAQVLEYLLLCIENKDRDEAVSLLKRYWHYLFGVPLGAQRSLKLAVTETSSATLTQLFTQPSYVQESWMKGVYKEISHVFKNAEINFEKLVFICDEYIEYLNMHDEIDHEIKFFEDLKGYAIDTLENLKAHPKSNSETYSIAYENLIKFLENLTEQNRNWLYSEKYTGEIVQFPFLAISQWLISNLKTPAILAKNFMATASSVPFILGDQAHDIEHLTRQLILENNRHHHSPETMLTEGEISKLPFNRATARFGHCPKSSQLISCPGWPLIQSELSVYFLIQSLRGTFSFSKKNNSYNHNVLALVNKTEKERTEILHRDSLVKIRRAPSES